MIGERIQAWREQRRSSRERHGLMRRLGGFGTASVLTLSQCVDKCTPPPWEAVTVPADSPAYYTYGGFRKAQAPNRESIRVEQNPHLTPEQMQQTITDWNRLAGWELFIITNNAPDITFEQNDALVGGGNDFRPFSNGDVNADGSFIRGKIIYDPDHARNPSDLIFFIEHELGHRGLGLKDITDGVPDDNLDPNIPQQCYSAAAPGYVEFKSIMSYCEGTKSPVPTESDAKSMMALGFVSMPPGMAPLYVQVG